MATTVTTLENNKVQISTPRLLLRPAQPADAQYLNPAFSDSEVMRYWSEPPHKNMERTQQWISKMVTSPVNGVSDFIITLLPEQTPIGKIGVWQDVEIGFLLARQHWGKGLAKEALAAVLNYLFEQKGLEEVTADIDPRNVASRGLLERMGFEQYEFRERTAEIAGVWVDSVYLRLRRGQWEERNGKKAGG